MAAPLEPEAFTATARSVLVANLVRALVVAAVVGTVLVLVNHGDHITEEPICDRFFLKCGISYLVPFLVSLGSAVMADRHRAHS
jgi:hypothetical protein